MTKQAALVACATVQMGLDQIQKNIEAAKYDRFWSAAGHAVEQLSNPYLGFWQLSLLGAERLIEKHL